MGVSFISDNGDNNFVEPWCPATADTFKEWDLCCQCDKTMSTKIEGYTGSVPANTAPSIDTVATNKHFHYRPWKEL